MFLEPLWTEGPVLPTNLTDLLPEITVNSDTDDDLVSLDSSDGECSSGWESQSDLD